MFDLIIAYFVIMFIVNTIKSVKEQQNKQPDKGQSKPGKYAPYGNKRFPTKKSVPPGRSERPVVAAQPQPQTAKRTQAPLKKESSWINTFDNMGYEEKKTGKKPSPAAIRVSPSLERNVAIDISEEERQLQRLLEPTEENILTGLIWSDILGPPVCKRRR